MKILILGGSGILSTDFSIKTLDMGNEVWLVNRGLRKIFIDERVKLIVADVYKESTEELKSKLNATFYDVVIDFLSFTPQHIKNTLNVVLDNCSQYIFISSATVYIKDNENEVITEKNRIGNKNWEYAYNKSLCEEYLSKENINYTIIRPYVTYGKSRIPFPIIPDGYHYTLIERIKEGKPILLLNDGNAICTLTHTKDFAEILYRLLLNEKAYKEDFHIVSPFTQTWKEVYLTLCKILNAESNYISVSIEQIEKYIPEFYYVLKGDKGTNMVFDNSKVLSAIGEYEFKVGLFEGLQNSVNYFESYEDMQGIDFRWDGRIDYLINKVTIGTKVKSIVIRNSYSNNLCLYYILRYQPLRGLYDFARFIKRKIIKKNRKICFLNKMKKDSLLEPHLHKRYFTIDGKLIDCRKYPANQETRYINMKLDYVSEKKVNTSKTLPQLYKKREDCCGCWACHSVCPVSAIAMEEDEEGFEYPVIDALACVKCYKCECVCPIKEKDKSK